MVSAPVATSMATFGRAEVGANRGKSPRLGVLLVGDTGFEPVTSSVSVISGTRGDAPAGVSDVRGRTQMITESWTD